MDKKLTSPITHSDQERLVKLLGEEYLGTPFLSVPEHVKEGSGSRDPGDFFWVSTDVVVAMWMKKIKHGKSEERTRLDVLKRVAGNLNQARGGLRFWVGDPRVSIRPQPLVLVNEHWSREIAYSSELAIVVLNIVDCEYPKCFIHDPNCINSVVNLAATVTSRFLRELLESGGSMLDLCLILKTVTWGDSGVSEQEAIADLDEYLTANFRRGGGYRKWKTRVNSEFKEDTLTLQAARGVRPAGTRGLVSNGIQDGLFAILMATHNFTFEDVTAVAVQLRKHKDAVLANKSLMGVFCYQRGNFRLFFHVGSLVDISGGRNKSNFDRLLRQVGSDVCFHYQYSPFLDRFQLSMQGAAPSGRTQLNKEIREA